jgi:hypothetical protein
MNKAQQQEALELLRQLASASRITDHYSGAIWVKDLECWRCVYCREIWNPWQRSKHLDKCPIKQSQDFLGVIMLEDILSTAESERP